MVLGAVMANSCIKAGIQATSIYALSGTGALKMSMSRRAGLNLNLGRFYRWMTENCISEAICDEVSHSFPILICVVTIKKIQGIKTTD